MNTVVNVNISNSAPAIEATLTDAQKNALRQSVGFVKYADLAARLGCSINDVRVFAKTVYAEREEQRVAEAARQKAELECQLRERQEKEESHKTAFLIAAKQLLSDGKTEELRALWNGRHIGEITEQIVETNKDVLCEAKWEYRYSHEDEVEEICEEVNAEYLENHEYEIENNFEDAVEEYLKKHRNEVYAIAAQELKNEIQAEADKHYDNFLKQLSA